MNTRRHVIRLAILAFAVTCHAQQSAPTLPVRSDAPTKEEVLKFLDVMHTKTEMAEAMQGIVAAMKEGAQHKFKSEVPDATPEQLAKFDALFDRVFDSIPIEDTIDAVVPIYQRRLTKSELSAAITFYSSPPGQKILKELPAITSEAMQAGGKFSRPAFLAKYAEFEARVADLMKASKK